MATMIERVMQAIAENLPSPYEQDIVWRQDASGELFDHLEACKHEGWERVARAAIEAMRDPTEGMLHAGRMKTTAEWIESGPDDVWGAMIEVAIKNEEWRDRLLALLPAARRTAQMIGPQHAFWDVIMDAEALMDGRPTLLKGSPNEVAHKLIDMFEGSNR